MRLNSFAWKVIRILSRICRLLSNKSNYFSNQVSSSSKPGQVPISYAEASRHLGNLLDHVADNIVTHLPLF
jgi:hypothetical protein